MCAYTAVTSYPSFDDLAAKHSLQNGNKEKIDSLSSQTNIFPVVENTSIVLLLHYGFLRHKCKWVNQLCSSFVEKDTNERCTDILAFLNLNLLI